VREWRGVCKRRLVWELVCRGGPVQGNLLRPFLFVFCSFFSHSNINSFISHSVRRVKAVAVVLRLSCSARSFAFGPFTDVKLVFVFFDVSSASRRAQLFLPALPLVRLAGNSRWHTVIKENQYCTIVSTIHRII
jgi:hypothetical protein